ncbi:MAG TPA: J domain-containing protein [Chthoniobacteraceae bacterium]|jgi:curved DNA-binding protein CbpA|nr:J domain-containing protein [Chthoniobacteraceae bacterium]
MLIDHFAALGRPRRPWLEPEALKEVFHRLTAEHHPDRTGDAARFTEINGAYAVLRDPVLRLRHLLELEEPAALAAAPPLPEALTATFMRIATLRRTIDAFVKQQAAATTPLGRALLAAARFSLQRDVELELADLETAQALGLEALREADRQWEERSPALVEQLAALQQELSYLAKWGAQLREALFLFQAAG